MNTPMRIGIPDGYVDTKTLAAMKGVTPYAVRDSIMRCRIQAVKIGDLWAIPNSEVKRYLQSRRGRPKKNNASLAAKQEAKGDNSNGNSK